MFSFPPDVYELLRSDIRDLDAELKFLQEHVPKGGRVLDIGCGTGTIARALSQRNGARVMAIDNCPQFIEYAAEDASKRGSPDVEFMCVDATESESMRSFGSRGSFDAMICMFGVLPLIAYGEIPNLLKWIRDRISPGGALVLDVGICLNFVERYEPSQIIHHANESLSVTRLVSHSIDPVAGLWRHKERLIIDRSGNISSHYTEFDQHILKATELSLLLHHAGFESLSFFSGYDREDRPGRDAACMLIVAR